MILNVKLRDKIKSFEIRSKAKSTDIGYIIKK